MRTRAQARAAASGFILLPPDIIAHILTMPCLSVEDLAQMDQVCRLFAFAFGHDQGKPVGHSIVEAALRLRRCAQTGISVPATLPREPWWTWPSLKAKLFHDERCRRGVRLLPNLPQAPSTDHRKGVVFFHGEGGVGTPPDEIVLGRMTRAFDNRQGIQDPRVSRQHLRVSLLNDFAPSQPSGLARVLGLGHNPSTIRRANPSHRPGEPASFKLRRGDTATLYPGDIIQLVCEDVSRAHGRSLPFEGNPCAYRIEFIPESCDLSPPLVVYGRDADREGTEVGTPEQVASSQAASQ